MYIQLLHKMQSEHIGENFSKLKGLLLSHQYLRFIQKKKLLDWQYFPGIYLKPNLSNHVHSIQM